MYVSLQVYKGPEAQYTLNKLWRKVWDCSVANYISYHNLNKLLAERWKSILTLLEGCKYKIVFEWIR